MKGLVLYHSRSGSTETYARWIAESTGFDCRPLGKAGNLKGYDTLVVGSYILAGGSKAVSWIKQNQGKLKGKKVICFSVSGALKGDPVLQDNWKKAMPEDIRVRVPYFPLNGKMVFAELKPFDRKLMQLAIKMADKQNPEEAKRMAEEYNRVNRDDLKPLLESLGC
jgi:menaquinone-dependent protoporphyrinogen IX oxidase